MSETWTRAADAAALDAADGGILRAVVAGRELCLYLADGAVYATDNICTHGLARLSDGYLDGHLIECPLHQGLFDIRDGSPAGAPCVEAIKAYPARRDGDAILVSVEE